MKTNYKNMSDHDLTHSLSKLNKELSKVKAKLKSSNPKTPGEVIGQVKLNDEISRIEEIQISIGRELLARDELRIKANEKKLAAKSLAGRRAADEMLQKLPEFASQVSVAFEALGQQYGELLELSDNIRKANLLMLSANKPQCVPSALRIEPNNLHKLLKEQFRTCFGSDAANVFLPQQTPNFEITEAVKLIQQECTERTFESCLIGV